MFIFNSLTDKFYEGFIGTSQYIRRAPGRHYSDVKSEYPQHVLYPRNRERGLDFANSRQASDGFRATFTFHSTRHPWTTGSGVFDFSPVSGVFLHRFILLTVMYHFLPGD
jgi:hypothetical protein